MNTMPDRPLDDILASIRKIVEEGQPVLDSTAEDLTEIVPPPPAPLPLPLQIDTDPSIEALTRSILEPQIRAWLDAHLPELVERITREEILRLTGH